MKVDNQIIDIRRQGEDTVMQMQTANSALRSQRDKIQDIANKNENINKNLKAGKQVIAQISRQEFKQRAILYAAIVILFITDIILAIYMLSRIGK